MCPLYEKIDLRLYDKQNTNSAKLLIEEDDIAQPHRLWTLYKLADRNASGADKLIDEIIFKYSDDLPF